MMLTYYGRRPSPFRTTTHRNLRQLDIEGVSFDSKQPLANSERRWGEAPEFPLDQLGEGDRRAVFEIAPDDLDTDRQPFGALADRRRRPRQPDKYRDPGRDALVVIRHLAI